MDEVGQAPNKINHIQEEGIKERKEGEREGEEGRVDRYLIASELISTEQEG